MLKKLKALFVVEDENDKKAPADKKEEAQANVKKDSESKSQSSPSIEVDLGTPNEISGSPDPKFIDILLKAIEKNNLDGFDYLEYKQSLQSLNNMGMDDATKYKSAFAMAKTMGATTKKLEDSANHYITILNEEQRKFKDALVNQRSKQIKGREINLINLQKSITAKTKQIEQLKKEIVADENKLEKIKREINESAAKVENTNDNFHAAFNIVINQIKDDLKNIKVYLKE